MNHLLRSCPGAETWRSCHLKCLLDALRRDEEHPRAAGVETSFGESVLELVTRAEMLGGEPHGEPEGEMMGG